MRDEAQQPKSGMPWTEVEESELADLVRVGTPLPEIATKLGRSEIAIDGKVKELRRRAAGRARRYAVRRQRPLPATG